MFKSELPPCRGAIMTKALALLTALHGLLLLLLQACLLVSLTRNALVGENGSYILWPLVTLTLGYDSDDQFPTFDAKSKFAKIQKSDYSGRGFMLTNFQLLMLSPNLVKSQSSITMLGGGWTTQFPTFDAKSKSSKIPKSHYGGRELVGDDQFPTFDAKSKSAKIQKFHYGGEGGGGDDQLPTFDAKFKSAKIPKSHYSGVGGGHINLQTQVQLSKLQSKSKFSIAGVGVGGW